MKYQPLIDFIIENSAIDGELSLGTALAYARAGFKEEYVTRRVWEKFPVEVIQLSATVITTKDVYKLRRKDFYTFLVEDALDVLFYECEGFTRRFKAEWKKEKDKCECNAG